MKYSYEYKRKCVEMYRQGKWPETPEGIQKENVVQSQVAGKRKSPKTVVVSGLFWSC